MEFFKQKSEAEKIEEKITKIENRIAEIDTELVQYEGIGEAEDGPMRKRNKLEAEKQGLEADRAKLILEKVRKA